MFTMEFTVCFSFFHTSLNRSRSSQSSHRYDGYSSDTGAFDSRAFIDEVDYRRPLHVQTPNRPNERYHTITKTTTMTNERPFVSVKRAHEQSKANNNIIGVSAFYIRFQKYTHLTIELHVCSHSNSVEI